MTRPQYDPEDTPPTGLPLGSLRPLVDVPDLDELNAHEAAYHADWDCDTCEIDGIICPDCIGAAWAKVRGEG